MPTFSFLTAPEILTNRLRRRSECSPTDSSEDESYSFGTMFDARLFSALGHSTSELLRTL